jgi:hypothetical protein
MKLINFLGEDRRGCSGLRESLQGYLAELMYP